LNDDDYSKMMDKRSDLYRSIANEINKLSLEGFYGDTPDYVLAEFVIKCLDAFRDAKYQHRFINRNL